MPPPDETPANPATEETLRARVRALFIEVFRRTGNVTAAADAAGVTRATPYRWREADPAFAAAWAEAEESATDALEAEARRRAVDGWDEPVFYKGEARGVVRKYSDRMLEILLKGHRPAFRESRLELTGPNGAPIAQTVAHEFSDEHYAQLIRASQAAGFVANGALSGVVTPPAPPVGGAAASGGDVAPVKPVGPA